MNRIDRAFEEKRENLLNVYFTAGYPRLEDTSRIITALEASGADLVEIGIPYSDPIADGPTIQESSTVAINNGMGIKVLFEQLRTLRTENSIPVILMGYLNPVLQFGFEEFCQKCQEVGIDGLILPDLPMFEYENIYRPILDQYGLYNIFLITPQTSDERIRKVDELSNGFVYMVSSSSITGAKNEISEGQLEYFQRINAMGLKNKTLIGFGISTHETFEQACQYSDGAIVGSAFINQLKADASDKAITGFVKRIKEHQV